MTKRERTELLEAIHKLTKKVGELEKKVGEGGVHYHHYYPQPPVYPLWQWIPQPYWYTPVCSGGVATSGYAQVQAADTPFEIESTDNGWSYTTSATS